MLPACEPLLVLCARLLVATNQLCRFDVISTKPNHTALALTYVTTFPTCQAFDPWHEFYRSNGASGEPRLSDDYILQIRLLYELSRRTTTVKWNIGIAMVCQEPVLRQMAYIME